MPPRPKSCQQCPVAVEKQRRKTQIEIELELRQVQRVRIDHPHADKLIQQWCHLARRQNAGVHPHARQTGHAAQHHQQRLSARLRLRKPLVDVVVDPALISLHLRLVAPHRSLAILDGFRKSGAKTEADQDAEERGGEFHVADISDSHPAAKPEERTPDNSLPCERPAAPTVRSQKTPITGARGGGPEWPGSPRPAPFATHGSPPHPSS